MSRVAQLYQELILDHSKHPRGNRFPKQANREAEGRNPLCGDHVTVKLRLDGDVVTDVGFEGDGCAISVAAASTMTEVVKGKTRRQVDALFRAYHDLITGKSDEAARRALGKLGAFAGVSNYPMRVKCASLPWHALKAALDGTGTATTEQHTG
jgi:nitrogen fixation NifU-like protein